MALWSVNGNPAPEKDRNHHASHPWCNMCVLGDLQPTQSLSWCGLAPRKRLEYNLTSACTKLYSYCEFSTIALVASMLWTNGTQAFRRRHLAPIFHKFCFAFACLSKSPQCSRSCAHKAHCSRHFEHTHHNGRQMCGVFENAFGTPESRGTSKLTNGQSPKTRSTSIARAAASKTH